MATDVNPRAPHVLVLGTVFDQASRPCTFATASRSGSLGIQRRA
jgi:hypothetical protein